MVERLDTINLVSDVLTLGRLLIFLPPLLAGYLVARPYVSGGQAIQPTAKQALPGGLVVGLIAAGMTALGILAVEAFPDNAVRNIFTSVTPALINILTMQLSLWAGVTVLFLGSAAAG